jgi:hypothetical protein
MIESVACRAHPRRGITEALTGTRGAEEKRKKSDVPTFLPFLRLRLFEVLRSDFRKYFYGVFGLLVQRNGQKRDKKKSAGKYERIFFS